MPLTKGGGKRKRPNKNSFQSLKKNQFIRYILIANRGKSIIMSRRDRQNSKKRCFTNKPTGFRPKAE